MNMEDFFLNASPATIADLVPQFYREDIQFRDPLVALQGRDQLIAYYNKLLEAAEELHFVFGAHLIDGDTHMLAWTMTATVGRLNDGKPFHVDGISHFKYANGMVYYHRDYFDLSAMLLEKLPVLGGLVSWLKKRAAQAAADSPDRQLH